MTAPSTDELTELLAECTPGKWELDGIAVSNPSGVKVCLMGEPLQFAGDINTMMDNYETNARLIAAAPAIAADLIALRKAAEGMADALRGVVEDATDHEQGYITIKEISDTAVDRCATALAAYEATK